VATLPSNSRHIVDLGEGDPPWIVDGPHAVFPFLWQREAVRRSSAAGLRFTAFPCCAPLSSITSKINCLRTPLNHSAQHGES